MKNPKDLYWIIPILVICISSCKATQDHSRKFSERKQRMSEDLKYWKRSERYKEKYDLDKYKYNATDTFISPDKFISCLISFNFYGKSLNISRLPEQHPYLLDSINAQTIYNNENKIFIIPNTIDIYEDNESAKMGLEMLFYTSQADLYQHQDECKFDLCFTENDKTRAIIHNKILWANIVITYVILPEYFTKKYGESIKPEDYPKYQEMNLRILDEFGRAFEDHLINCPL